MADFVSAGTLTLPSPLPVQPEAWGHSFTTAIAGVPVVLALPKAQPPDGPGTVRPSAIRQVDLLWPASVRAPSESELRDFDRAVSHWYRCVLAWVCAWTGLAPPTDRSVDVNLQLFDQAGALLKRDQGQFLFYGFPNELGATRDQLEAALRLGADLTPLPTEYALLVDAQGAFGDFRNRVCVISAAGAAEVALVRRFEDTLANSYGLPEAFVGWVETRARGLAALDQACRNLEVETGAPKRDVELLARARNRAAHAGSEVDREETTKLLQTAQLVVRTLRPLQLTANQG